MYLNRRDGNVAEEDHPKLDIDFEEPDYDSEEDDHNRQAYFS